MVLNVLNIKSCICNMASTVLSTLYKIFLIPAVFLCVLLLLSPFYRCGEGLENLPNLPQVAQLLSYSVRAQMHSLTPGATSKPCYFLGL